MISIASRSLEVVHELVLKILVLIAGAGTSNQSRSSIQNFHGLACLLIAIAPSMIKEV